MEKTEWRLSDQPASWTAYLAGPLPLTAWWLVRLGRDDAWPTLGFWIAVALCAVIVGISWYATHRLRVRLTPEGIEVRRYRTRIYPWTEITSVRLAPEWDSKSVLVRTRSMHPQAADDVLPLPSASGRKRSDTTLDDAVRTINARLASQA